MKNIILFVSVVTAFLFLSNPVNAAYIEKVKGKKALIYLDGMSVTKGDLVYTVDAGSGKKTSILRITTVKDQKAIGELVKGKVKNDQEVIPRNGKTAQKSSDSSAPSESRTRKGSARNSQFAIGGLLGMNFDSMDITISGQEVKKSGTGFGLGGVLDYNINSWFALRGILSYDTFNASGDASSAICSGSTNCTTKISYLTSMVWGKINVIQKETKAWVGAGFGIWFPISKSSNAIDQSSIATTGAYALGGGVDMSFSDTLYIPIQLEYGFLPKSTDVTSSYYSVRAGLMLKY